MSSSVVPSPTRSATRAHMASSSAGLKAGTVELAGEGGITTPGSTQALPPDAAPGTLCGASAGGKRGEAATVLATWVLSQERVPSRRRGIARRGRWLARASRLASRRSGRRDQSRSARSTSWSGVVRMRRHGVPRCGITRSFARAMCVPGTGRTRDLRGRSGQTVVREAHKKSVASSGSSRAVPRSRRH